MKAKRSCTETGFQTINFYELFLTIGMDDLEIKVYGMNDWELSDDVSCLVIDEAIRQVLMKMIDFVQAITSEINNKNLFLEFSRADRNKILKRLILCLYHFLIKYHHTSCYSFENTILLVQCINFTFDIYDANAQLRDLKYAEICMENRMQTEIETLEPLLHLLRLILERYSIPSDCINVIFEPIAFSIQCIQDYINYCRDNSYESLHFLRYFSHVGTLLFDMMSSQKTAKLVGGALECLCNCCEISSNFCTHIATKYLERIHVVLEYLISGHSINTVGEVWNGDHQEIISILFKLTCLCLMKNVHSLVDKFDFWSFLIFTLGLMQNFGIIDSNITVKRQKYVLESFVVVFLLSKESLHNIPHMFELRSVQSYIQCMAKWFDQAPNSQLSAFLLSLIRNWIGIYNDHLVNTIHIKVIVQEIMKSGLVSRHILPMLGQNLTTTHRHAVVSLFSFMQSSLNSNDINHIHLMGDFLSAQVFLPFIEGHLGLTHQQEQQIANALVDEKRFYPMLVENNFLALEHRGITFSIDTVQMLKETKLESSRLKSMLRMLPKEQANLLSIIESDLIKKIEYA